MGDSLDMAVAHEAVLPEDQAAINATLVPHVAAPDDISQSYVSKEVGQALSYSATAEEMKSNAARIVVTTVTPAPSGAQDSHILKPVPHIKFQERRSSELDDPPEWKHKGSTSASGGAAIAIATTAGPSGAKDDDRPDLDKFEFPVDQQPAPLPPKPRKPILKALTLPEEHPSPQPSPRGSDHGSQRGTPMGPMPTYFAAAGPMTSKRPPKALTRLKTRLQDPPPMTPSVSEMMGRGRQYTGGLFNEQGLYEQGMMTSRVVPAGRKQSAVAGNLSRVASFAAATPGKLRSMASKIFTPQGTPNTPAPVPEIEEIDPLDDESIPKYKKWKRTRNKWLHIMEWVSLIVVCTLLTCSVRVERLRNVYWLQIVLWQWVTLALVVLCGRLISGWAVKLLVLLIERHYLLKRRVLYFVYGLRHSVKNCIWLALVIGTWKVILRNETDQSTIPVITKILWCFFTASLLWMAKVLFVKTAANSFHRAAYFDRIQDCLFHQYVLETISQPKTVDTDDYWGMGVRHEENKFQEHAINIGGSNVPHVPIVVQRAMDPGQFSTVYESQPYVLTPSRGSPQYSPATGLQTSRGKVSYVGLPSANDGKDPEPAAVVIAQDKLQELTSDTVSAWTLKRLMKLVRTSNMSTFSSMLSADWEIDSEAQAKSAAKQIFYNMADPGAKFLTLRNFMEFLPEDKAAEAFALFEVSDQGQISKKALMKWVVSVYKERKALSLTLSDNRTVVAKLHRVLDVLMLAILLTICFLIMGVNTQKLLVAFSSILLPSVFVFGNAARSTFESLIFLFIMHPFDVGDRIMVDNVSLVVEEMNILNTIFLSGSNEKVYYPNSVLASKPISNFYRSPDQWDTIDFQIHATTPVEKIGLLKEKMTKYIEGLPQYWYPTFRLLCKDIEDSNRMKMALWMQHHMNYQEAGERWQRRSNMILHMKTLMEELEIGFRLPRQEITVTGIPLLDVPRTQL